MVRGMSSSVTRAEISIQPEAASYEHDPRIAAVQKQLDRTGADLPQECVRITAGEFATLIFACTYNIPSYGNWVLKSPGHLWSLEAMMAAYPDARLIQTHRDPLKITASLSSLISTLRLMAGSEVDPTAIGKQWSHWNTNALNDSVRIREAGIIPNNQIIDISFYKFMDAPLEQIQSIYDFLELELSASTRKKMQEYLNTHTSEQHGAHKYQFSDFGLDVAEERERIRPYQEYFDVRSEIQ